MSAISYDRLRPRRAKLRSAALRRAIGERWRSARPVLLLALPIALVLIAVGFAIFGFRTMASNRTVAELRDGHDIPVKISAAPEVLLARIQYLLAHDRVDEVQAYVEALDRSGADKPRAIAHYNFANGRLRQAFDEIGASRVDKAGPFVVLSRQEYRRALTLEPEMWDAKFNFDVASRLVRDFPSFERTMGDEVKTKKKLWTDVPGKPEGLP